MSHVDLLREEYFKLQDIVESFDARALQIKGWSVTVSLAALGAALIANGISDRQRALACLLSALAALAFWVIEFLWKCFQWSFIPRIRMIEDAFQSGSTLGLAPLQIRRFFHGNFRKDLLPNLPRAFLPFVALPHGLIALAGLLCAAHFHGPWGMNMSMRMVMP